MCFGNQEPSVCNPPVCAIVLNWNQPGLTIDCLDSLLDDVLRGRLAIVVCDNRSEDDSLHRIRAWAERRFDGVPVEADRRDSETRGSDRGNWSFLLLDTGGNRGYAGGNNAAIRLVLEEARFRFIWLLNNDTLAATDCLDNLIEFASTRPDAGIIGSTIVDFDDRRTVQTAGGCRYNPATTVVSPISAGSELSELLANPPQLSLDYVMGAAMFMRSELLLDTGLLDERFFLYYEELDMAIRSRSLGYTMRWCPKSIVYHLGAASTGTTGSGPTGSPFSQYHENLSTLLFTAKHYPWLLPIALPIRGAGKLLAAARRRRTTELTALWRALLDFAIAARREIPRYAPPKKLWAGTKPGD